MCEDSVCEEEGEGERVSVSSKGAPGLWFVLWWETSFLRAQLPGSGCLLPGQHFTPVAWPPALGAGRTA